MILSTKMAMIGERSRYPAPIFNGGMMLRKGAKKGSGRFFRKLMTFINVGLPYGLIGNQLRIMRMMIKISRISKNAMTMSRIKMLLTP